MMSSFISYRKMKKSMIHFYYKEEKLIVQERLPEGNSSNNLINHQSYDRAITTLEIVIFSNWPGLWPRGFVG